MCRVAEEHSGCQERRQSRTDPRQRHCSSRPGCLGRDVSATHGGIGRPGRGPIARSGNAGGSGGCGVTLTVRWKSQYSNRYSPVWAQAQLPFRVVHEAHSVVRSQYGYCYMKLPNCFRHQGHPWGCLTELQPSDSHARAAHAVCLSKDICEARGVTASKFQCNHGHLHKLSATVRDAPSQPMPAGHEHYKSSSGPARAAQESLRGLGPIPNCKYAGKHALAYCGLNTSSAK